MAQDESPPVSPLFDALRARSRVLVAAGLLALMAFGGAQLWRVVGQRVAADPRYRVTADSIEVTPPPAWVRGDLRSEALENAGLGATAIDGPPLSSLAPPEMLEARIADAFGRHPWVRSVEGIRKQPPNRLRVDLVYRVPLAAVSDAGQPHALRLIDAEAARLPERDLTTAELRHLPRVALPSSVRGLVAPPLGEAWPDPRVQGAAAIIAGLGDAWWDLGLVTVTPSRQPEARADGRYFTYEMVTAGGTRIGWGAAPIAAPRDESPFSQKFQRLVDHVRANGPLSSVESPRRIDVRTTQVLVEPRTVKKPEEAEKDRLLK